ncbi:MAG: response regulator, partial [Hyphomicrobiaceae bacterium]
PCSLADQAVEDETVGEPDAPVLAAYAEILPCADADGWTSPVVEAAPELIGEAVPAEADLDDIEDDAESAPQPSAGHEIPILIAEDDPDDRMFMREAFGESDFNHDIAFVENGEELLSYLNGEGDYAGRKTPGLILLDLNMPKMDGRTALLHIKANPLFRRIPVIILTTSRADDDIEKTYDLGVSSYISKPSSAEGLKEVIATLNNYWSNLVAFPAPR